MKADCFMVSPLGCLVQFTHSGTQVWDRWQADLIRLGSNHAERKLQMPRDVRLNAPPKTKLRVSRNRS
ncbi:MAG: hypothetical protein ACT4OT_04895, partial [Acidobacteriota bacterium]